MPLAPVDSKKKPASLPRPHTTIETNGATLRFYLADCVELLRGFEPGSVSAIVTSPPYNLGVRYRSYDDTLPRERYLEWTGAWIEAAARTLGTRGSLFLNVGAKPTDPWTALDVAQAARPHLTLQNTHPLGQVDRHRQGRRPAPPPALDRDLAVGHYKPINSDRFVNDCHEFIFHFTPEGRTPLDRRAIGVPYQDQSNVGRWQSAAPTAAAAATPGSSPTNDPEPRQGPSASGHLPAAPRRVLPAPARDGRGCAW